MTAAIAMLNDKHPQLQNPVTDSNAYALGTPAGHNVVIACLPFGIYGTIQYALMVGIGGGVPSKLLDIRLGDVVVSKPTGQYSGVVQYDYGKTVRGGRFEQTGMLNHPPQLLLTHISRLEAERRATKDNNGISGVIAKVLDERPSMIDEFGCPGPDQDVLFSTAYHHTSSNDNCNDCDSAQRVQRDPLGSLEPQVCYGLIASGDKVMKDSQTRDRLAHETGAICFEMGAAGLMNQLPCLVIRGICDYADSYKNRKWQGNAAPTAAVYGKLLSSAEVEYSHHYCRRITKCPFLRQKQGPCLLLL
ncbi:nucleoside phosphorylase domain-containing protein [Aspergillus alliaceus]|uniref:Nucleoside phosphorylase domain-containing protein n=1 Tax=Petromyces alliaceus TaxID=209559 RepID=A0A5N7BYY5_PETAA|nr:nucleoside phosphorylase domain-containing protein [Aspergillus alliaceus]